MPQGTALAISTAVHRQVRGALHPAASLRPAPVIATEGRDLPAGRAEQGVPPLGPSCRPGARQDFDPGAILRLQEA